MFSSRYAVENAYLNCLQPRRINVASVLRNGDNLLENTNNSLEFKILLNSQVQVFKQKSFNPCGIWSTSSTLLLTQSKRSDKDGETPNTSWRTNSVIKFSLCYC